MFLDNHIPNPIVQETVRAIREVETILCRNDEDMPRRPYRQSEYRHVILPLTFLRRLDCVLAATKQTVLDSYKLHVHQSDTFRQQLLEAASGQPYYNTSSLDFGRLLDDPNRLAQNFHTYIGGFSENVQEIIEALRFAKQITRMDEGNLLQEVIKTFAEVDLSPERLDNNQMSQAFRELVRVAAEQYRAEEHYTPADVTRLAVSLLFSHELDLG